MENNTLLKEQNKLKQRLSEIETELKSNDTLANLGFEYKPNGLYVKETDIFSICVEEDDNEYDLYIYNKNNDCLLEDWFANKNKLITFLKKVTFKKYNIKADYNADLYYIGTTGEAPHPRGAGFSRFLV